MLCALYMYSLLTDAVSGLYNIASNYFMFVINEPDNKRRRKTKNEAVGAPAEVRYV